MMIKLELSEQQVRIIAEIIGNAPYKVAAPILADLQRQIDAQAPVDRGLMSNGAAVRCDEAPPVQ